MWKVLRARACHFPLQREWPEGEFGCHEGVFAAQGLDVGVLTRVRLRNQSCLPEKECLSGEQFVAVTVKKLQWQVAGYGLERLAVKAESEGACKGYVCRAFPMSACLFYYCQYAFAFFEETFCAQRCEPVCVIELWQIFNGGGARQSRSRVFHQPVAPAGGIGCAVYYYLRDEIAVAAVDGCIVNLHNMKNHRIICRVGVVMMAEPVGRADMNLHVSCPLLAVDFDGGVEKVRACICVECARMYHAHFAVVHSLHVWPECQTVLPYKLEEGFHGAFRGDRRLIPLNYTFSLRSASICAGVLCSRG